MSDSSQGDFLWSQVFEPDEVDGLSDALAVIADTHKSRLVPVLIQQISDGAWQPSYSAIGMLRREYNRAIVATPQVAAWIEVSEPADEEQEQALGEAIIVLREWRKLARKECKDASDPLAGALERLERFFTDVVEPVTLELLEHPGAGQLGAIQFLRDVPSEIARAMDALTRFLDATPEAEDEQTETRLEAVNALSELSARHKALLEAETEAEPASATEPPAADEAPKEEPEETPEPEPAAKEPAEEPIETVPDVPAAKEPAEEPIETAPDVPAEAPPEKPVEAVPEPSLEEPEKAEAEPPSELKPVVPEVATTTDEEGPLLTHLERYRVASEVLIGLATNDPATSVRVTALQALTELGGSSDELWQTALSAIKDDDPDIRQAAARLLVIVLNQEDF